MAAIVFSLFVLIGNPLIVLMIMGAMGYRRRTGFLAGLTVAQISEFSLIVAAMGLKLGQCHASPTSMPRRPPGSVPVQDEPLWAIEPFGPA